MELKPPKTTTEQLEILKERNLIIESEERALEILQSINYYTFTGYLYQHKNKSGKYEDISFEQAHRIYQCDMRIRSIILYATESAERNLKTKISYVIAHNHGALAYTDVSLFKDVDMHSKMMEMFTKSINRNSSVDFVSHHIKKYDSQFPVWVATELFTLGMLHMFYRNLKTGIQKQIAKSFGLGPVYLTSWMESVAYLRNLCAHYMRLYRFNINQTPKQSLHHNKTTSSNKIFDIIYVLKYLVADRNDWNNYVLQKFSQIFDEYNDCVSPHDYGFPEDWLSVLKI